MANNNTRPLISRIVDKLPIVGRAISKKRATEQILSEFGNRLERIEQDHGDALKNFGNSVARAEQCQAAFTIRLENLECRIGQYEAPHYTSGDLPPENFLGFTPQRYSTNVEAYKRQGGIFDLGYYQPIYNNGDLIRLYSFGMFFDLIRKDKIPGDIAEIGVWKGDTAIILANFARSNGINAYLLDTYEGFDSRDLSENENHLRGCFSDTSLETVRARIGDESVHYIKGYFPDTSIQLPPDNRYCFINIDCDLYGPVLSALEYFYPRIAEGGFLIIHDYMSLMWDGPIKAVDEFFSDKPEQIIPLSDYAGSVVIRKIGRVKSFV